MEAAFIPKELFTATLPFTAVDSNFRTAKNLNTELYPLQIPNLNLFLSSASDVSSEMYAQYKEAFHQMMLGNTNYFVADLDNQGPFIVKCSKNNKPNCWKILKLLYHNVNCKIKREGYESRKKLKDVLMVKS